MSVGRLPTYFRRRITSTATTVGETGLMPLVYAVARYDFAVHGGAVGTIPLGVTVPAGAILIGRGIQVIEAFNEIEPYSEEDLSVAGFTLDTPENEILTSHQAPVAWPELGVGQQPPEYIEPPANHGWNVLQTQFTYSMPSGNFSIAVDREIKFIIQDVPITAGVIDCYALFLLPQE